MAGERDRSIWDSVQLNAAPAHLVQQLHSHSSGFLKSILKALMIYTQYVPSTPVSQTTHFTEEEALYLVLSSVSLA